MALADILRSGIALAKSTLSTGAMLSPVTVETWTNQNDAGEAIYGSPVTYQALVTTAARDSSVSATGEIVAARCKVIFLEDVEITPLDRVTLADGSSGPIVRVDDGFVDASGRMMTVVWIGYRR